MMRPRSVRDRQADAAAAPRPLRNARRPIVRGTRGLWTTRLGARRWQMADGRWQVADEEETPDVRDSPSWWAIPASPREGLDAGRAGAGSRQLEAGSWQLEAGSLVSL